MGFFRSFIFRSFFVLRLCFGRSVFGGGFERGFTVVGRYRGFACGCCFFRVGGFVFWSGGSFGRVVDVICLIRYLFRLVFFG